MLYEYPQLDYMLRILLATLCGGVIGLERSFRLKEAGVRTHSIIACSSALYMVLSKFAFTDMIVGLDSGGADATMIACQVVNGINFLGAGIIFKGKNSPISGLTTATGIWATAAVGLACGSGLYPIAIFSAIFLVLLQMLLHHFNVGGNAYNYSEVSITLEKTPRIMEALRERQRAYGIEILDLCYKRAGENRYTLDASIRMKGAIPFEDALLFAKSFEEIKSIST